jgi:hypothetical protein
VEGIGCYGAKQLRIAAKVMGICTSLAPEY